MKVKIIIMPKESVLDPQGKTIGTSLEGLGYKGISDVRVGKIVEMTVDDKMDKIQVTDKMDDICKRLLVNTIIETYKIVIE